jgi:hypothetical protein
MTKLTSTPQAVAACVLTRQSARLLETECWGTHAPRVQLAAPSQPTFPRDSATQDRALGKSSRWRGSHRQHARACAPWTHALSGEHRRRAFLFSSDLALIARDWHEPSLGFGSGGIFTDPQNISFSSVFICGQIYLFFCDGPAAAFVF